MDSYIISVGQSRTTKKWKAVEYTFDQLYERLLTPIRTPETVEAYRRMRKDRKDEAKDVGGFVGGALAEGLRRADKVKYRTLLTLDIDRADPDTVDRIYMLCGYRAVIYSTHSHTPESPRLRLIVPLARSVSPDEYEAVARYTAQEWGADMFDPCSFRAHQLMYWPSCPIDGEYICRRIDGDTLDPDKVLAAHPNWRDLSELGADSGAPAAVVQVADPLQKPGIVGAFCRTYTVTTAMAVFLGGIYAPTDKPDRYDYVPADSSAGVMIYNDKFAYSHHATDPACGQLLNAFDLVRVHKFAGETEKKSFEDMVDMALHRPEVRQKMAVERLESAAHDFGATSGEESGELDWRSLLDPDKRGGFKEDYGNYILIMRNDPELKGIGYNLLSSSITKRGSYPWKTKNDSEGWSDMDFAQLQSYIHEKYGLFSEKKLRTALATAAAERKYHPIRNYLDNLPEWDGVDRVDNLLIDYLGAEDNAFSREAIRKTLLAAVMRVYRPGTKFDTALILNGPQGIGKSTLFKKLAVDWFSDSLMLTEMRDKSGAETLQGRWIVEIAELAGMRKAEIETVKAFLSRVDDRYRASYGRYTESHERQCVIVGSTNAQDGFLRDTTGNRRFWVVPVTGESQLKPWQMTDMEVRMVWAEIMTIYAAETEDLQLSPEAGGIAREAQDAAMEVDERAEIVEKYLNTPVPRDWYEKSLYDRRRYFQDMDDPLAPREPDGILRDRVSVLEVWCECFGQDGCNLDKRRSNELAGILREIGWEKNITGRLKGYDKRLRMFLRPGA